MRQRLGIATKVSLGLGGYTCALLGVAIVLWVELNHFNKLLDNTVDKQLPTLSAISEFGSTSERLKVIAAGITIAGNHLIRKSLLRELSDVKFKLKTLLDTLKEHSGNITDLPRIQSQLNYLSKNIQNIEDNARQQLNVQAQRSRIERRLRYLADKLNALSTQYPMLEQQAKTQSAFAAWQRHCNQAIITLLALPPGWDNSYRSRSSESFKSHITSARKALDEVPNELNNPLYDIQQEITLYGLEEKGLFSLYDTTVSLRNKAASLQLSNEFLSGNIAQTVERAFLASQAEFDAQRQDISQRFAAITTTLIGLFFLTLLMTGIIHAYLSRQVIAPVLKLHKGILQRRRGVTSPLPTEAKGEVGEMARSVVYFIDEIEQREVELGRSHNLLEQQVAERTAKLKKLSARLLQTQEEERARLAAELHDDIGATLGVIKFGMERAKRLLNSDDLDTAGESLTEAVNMVKIVASQLRRIQTELRPAHLDLGLIETITWFCTDFRSVYAHIDTRWHISLTENDIPTDQKVIAFRILQEALNNVAKHSNASKVDIYLTKSNGAIHLSILDDGDGFSEQEITSQAKIRSGLGLASMKERMDLSFGTLQIMSEPGKGTAIRASWPLPHK